MLDTSRYGVYMGILYSTAAFVLRGQPHNLCPLTSQLITLGSRMDALDGERDVFGSVAGKMGVPTDMVNCFG